VYRPAWSGQDASAWDQSWQWTPERFETAVKQLEQTGWYLQAQVEPYMRPGLRILEGGCGIGHIVAYFHDRGCDITGVDFASATVEAIRGYRPDLKVSLGDVAALGFPDDSFDVYYSGGVVEHFEEGPWAALAEAHRVLKPDGVLLISVPQTNLFRSSQDLWLRMKSALLSTPPRRAQRMGAHAADHYRLVSEMRQEPEPDFHLYMYRPSEFVEVLRRAGFRVERSLGTSIPYGLGDLDWVHRRLARRGSAGRAGSDAPSQSSRESRAPGSPPGEGATRSFRRVLGDLLVRERANGWLGRSIIRVAGAAFGNLRLYVARPER
jgi:ubiquinone/menaquinone biosynthesis C-methylase UbiE